MLMWNINKTSITHRANGLPTWQHLKAGYTNAEEISVKLSLEQQIRRQKATKPNFVSGKLLESFSH